MPYMVLDVLREVPVRMDMGTLPAHKTLVSYNRLVYGTLSNHPIPSAISFPLCDGCTLVAAGPYTRDRVIVTD